MVDFLSLGFENWVKKGKEKEQNIKIIDFFGTPYVRHVRRDLQTQILTILKTNSEFLILKFSGTTFVFVKWSNFVALLNTFISKTFTKNHQWFHLRFNKFQHRDASTLVPFYVSYSKGRNKSKGCFGISMNWTFKNWLTFYLYLLKTGWKKGKKNSKISKLLIFLGHPMFGTSAGTSKLRFWLFWK